MLYTNNKHNSCLPFLKWCIIYAYLITMCFMVKMVKYLAKDTGDSMWEGASAPEHFSGVDVLCSKSVKYNSSQTIL